MTKKKVIITCFIIASISTFFIILTTALKQNHRIDEKTKEVTYKGVIKKIKYDDKDYPTVYILDTCFYIGSRLNGIDTIVKVGDSIVKNYYRLDYVLYRKDGNGTWKLIYGDP